MRSVPRLPKRDRQSERTLGEAEDRRCTAERVNLRKRNRARKRKQDQCGDARPDGDDEQSDRGDAGRCQTPPRESDSRVEQIRTHQRHFRCRPSEERYGADRWSTYDAVPGPERQLLTTTELATEPRATTRPPS